MIWNNVFFHFCIKCVILVALLSLLAYHTYRCYMQKDLKGSPIKILKNISFKHLSFIVIIAAIIPVFEQTTMFILHFYQLLPHGQCRFTIQFGIIGLAIAKLALHLFVAVRSQITNTTTNIWYTLGLLLTWSDLLLIIYVISGIPTIEATPNGVLCNVINVSLSVYIWFAMNDFVIGIYYLLSFLLPLRKYIWLEAQQENPTTLQVKTNDTRTAQSAANTPLQDLAKRIMIFSGIALVSTMTFTVIAAMIQASGALLFPIDSLVNAVCVVLQFKHERTMQWPCSRTFRSLHSLKSISSNSRADSPTASNATPLPSTNNVTMIIHGGPITITSADGGNKSGNKPKLKDNVSLSMSLVDNDTHTRVEPDL
eukprot:200582_1